MRAQPVGVIVNPAAGGGRALRLLPRLAATLRELGEAHHVHITAAAGEASAVAADFARQGMRLVVAAGGDGTLNEVANGLLTAGRGRAVALGVVPAGRGIDYARAIAAPREADAALARACLAQPRQVDVGLVTFAGGATRHFVNIAGLGFDAAVAERAATSRLPGSHAPYLGALLAALWHHRGRSLTVTADGTTFAGQALAVVVANGHSFGGGFKIAPTAAIDDGLLDLALIGDLSRFDLLRNVPRVYRGRHTTHPRFTHLPIRSVRVETDEPVRVELDGEVVGQTPVTFTVVPGALWLAG